MSRRVVAALSRVVDGRSSRRGFLRRSAMGATALAVAPATYALRPTTAHAAVTGSEGTCSDGYTDFCCQLTGQNLCPPGTVVAGWWKADGSGMCDLEGQRRPRYYLDCNRTCPEGCGCGRSGVCGRCDGADCRCLGDPASSRKVDCTRFRYGQCNQDIPCVGAIACRIVTCVAPWRWHGSCARTPVLTDNRTRFHDRVCLHDGFTDVAPDAFYTEAVAWAFDNGITQGYNDDLFGPHELAPRSHMATFLHRYAGRPSVSGDNPFDDVEPGRFYTDAVRWMAAEGITTGTSPTTFSPDRLITRGEAITFLHRFAQSPEPTVRAPFTDVPAEAFYRTAVAWAWEHGITTGLSPTEFGGGQWIDRAQIVTLLHRFDQQVGAPVPA
jgi:hypothetical protein